MHLVVLSDITLTGLKVPMPTWSVTYAISTPFPYLLKQFFCKNEGLPSVQPEPIYLAIYGLISPYRHSLRLVRCIVEAWHTSNFFEALHKYTFVFELYYTCSIFFIFKTLRCSYKSLFSSRDHSIAFLKSLSRKQLGALPYHPLGVW